MSYRLPARSQAFTLVELLVVIAIMALLAGIALPSLVSTRESGRRAGCTNNLRQIGHALQTYASAKEQLPPASDSPVDVGVWNYKRDHGVSLHSWASLLLPYVEQNALQQQIDYKRSSLDPANRTVAAVVIELYHCPSFGVDMYTHEERYLEIAPLFALRNYVAMGATDVGSLWGSGPDGMRRPNGVMYYQSQTAPSDVTDGLSNTILLCETREPNAAVWIDGTGAAAVGRRFVASNAPTYGEKELSLNYHPYFEWGDEGTSIDSTWGPSSMHAGVVGHLFVDGSSRYVEGTIDRAVYDAMVTRAGNER